MMDGAHRRWHPYIPTGPLQIPRISSWVTPQSPLRHSSIVSDDPFCLTIISVIALVAVFLLLKKIRYQLLEQIGKPGSFGVVRVALHLTTDVKYAVKIIAKDKMDARTRQQMRNEVIILVLAVYMRRQL